MPELQEIAALLRWYEEIGVDAAVAATPFDLTSLARQPRRPPSDRPAAGRGAPRGPGPSTGPEIEPAAARPAERPAQWTGGPVADARAAAAAAMDLPALRAAVEAFEGCGLKAT
ncbi:MAG: uracil-DNA glycosylase, partial [Alphaproteobacteria bacterium]|nr:uracil-DNA glycosylase [Alphaproteobacteria bacterium]